MERGTRSLGRIAVAAAAVAAGIVVAPPAGAGCHSFTLSVDPATVTEGDRVTVTVERDGAVDPSEITVSTSDGTARAGEDYTELSEKVEFTSETRQTFEITTADDDEAEEDETFTVGLSDPGGCAVNPSFAVDSDKRVTIRDNDEAAASPTVAPSPTETVAPVAAEDEGGGLSGAALAGIIAGAAAVIGAVFALLRRRGAGGAA